MVIKYLGLDRLGSLARTIRGVGGLRAAIKKLHRFDDLRPGKHVGTDQYGNRYYTNSYYFYGRNRWVEYSDQFGWDYDASHIPADWYGWLHYKTDLIPELDGSRPKYKWMSNHSENLSGTKEQYMPYTTTRPKITPWDWVKACPK